MQGDLGPFLKEWRIDMRLIRSVSRALEILEVINQRPSSIVELSRRTGLPRTTVLRVVRTLIESGYVFKSEVRGDKVYFVAPDAKKLSCGVKSWYQDYMAIKSLLEDLGQEMEWPVYFAVNDGFDMEVIESTERQSPFYLRDSILGDRLPLVRSASGLAFLSVCDEPVRQRLLHAIADEIDGTDDYRWIQEKITNAKSTGCVTLENCDWQAQDRPVSSMAIGLRNAERAFGSVAMRYYSKAYIAPGTLDKWSDKLIAFANDCYELEYSPSAVRV